MSVVPLRGKLRVEEPAAPEPEAVSALAPAVAAPAVVQDVDWRKLAIQSGQRLQHLENQAKALHQAADEARSRMTKYKDRLDSASASNNTLQAQVIALSAETESLKAKLVAQDVVKQKVWEIRQAMLDGPLFELFGEYCK